MGIFDSIRFPASVLERLLAVPIRYRYRTHQALYGSHATIFAIGASLQADGLCAIQFGAKGSIYCGWPLWDTAAQRGLCLMMRYDSQFQLSTTWCGDAISFAHGTDFCAPRAKSREFRWETGGFWALSEAALKTGHSILSGKYLCPYPWSPQSIPE